MFEALLNTDPVIGKLIASEETRQQSQLTLIASENYVSRAVRDATASMLTNKYAEGYPGKRYYGGCSIVDQIEQLAIDRCKKLFNAPHANVQPHAGCQANAAVFLALLKPGDPFLGMNLAAGGHLTHGHSVNFSGTLYRAISYGVHPETELIDYDQMEALAHQHTPKMIIVGASAYSRSIDFARCGIIAKSVGAYLMADIAHIAGLVAAGLHSHPFPHADVVTSTTHKTLRGPRGGIIMCSSEVAPLIDRALFPGMQGGPLEHTIAAKAVAFHEAAHPSFITYQKQVIANAQAMARESEKLGYRVVAGGTDNHLFILDLRKKNITGRAAEVALEKVGITVSRSCIPNDPEKAWITSGIRIGTPAITTRGMQEQDALALMHLVDRALMHATDDTVLTQLADEVRMMSEQFPIRL